MELPKYEIDFKSMLGMNPFVSIFGNSANQPLPIKNKISTKFKQIQSILNMEGIQARTPFEMEIE